MSGVTPPDSRSDSWHWRTRDEKLDVWPGRHQDLGATWGPEATKFAVHAPEGGVSLTPYAAVRAWIARVEALPGFIPMPASPIPETV